MNKVFSYKSNQTKVLKIQKLKGLSSARSAGLKEEGTGMLAAHRLETAIQART